MSTVRIPSSRPCLGVDEIQAVERVFESRWLGLGAVTRQFEQAIAELIGVRHVVAVNTRTAALHLALHALGIGPGDDVIVPSLTFISSAQAILAVGARPVFCEVLQDSLKIDVEDAARKLTAKTRAIMPVHYGGGICDMAGLRALVAGRGIWLVEDAAHAFGSTCEMGSAGALGDVGCFSFDPIKNITCGGGGALATNHDATAARARPAANVGIDGESRNELGEKPWWYAVVASGYRYRMTDLHAAIGLAQIDRMQEFRARKKQIVRAYDRAFGGIEALKVVTPESAGRFPFNYVVRVLDGRRDGLIAFLRKRGIGSAVQFIPCHLQPVFGPSSVSLPVAERLYGEIVSLPLYCEMSHRDLEEVICGVREFCGQGA